jgi:hypothetical protein
MTDLSERVARFATRQASRFLEFVRYYPGYVFARSGCGFSECNSVPSIFIVGAPRTGSTILYQALTNCYDVKYIDNLAASWYKKLPFGMWLSHQRFGVVSHNNYVAEYGNTAQFGEHAPSECGQFWYRWFPKEDHFVDAGVISLESINQIRAELSAVTGMFGLPLLLKNLNMGQRLRVVKEFAPQSRIIFIRRDPKFAVRSILKARKKMGVSQNEMWSVRPKNYRELQVLPEVEMCAAQVFYLEEQIKADLALFPDNNVTTVQYNELSKEMVEKLGNWLGLAKKAAPLFPGFKKDTIDLIPGDELSMLEAVIGKYDFDNGVFC